MRGKSNKRPSTAAGVSSRFVVGIGASAGGLTALSQLLKALPTQAGLTFVVVQHRSPATDGHLDALLSRVTTLPVLPIKATTRLKANHIYVAPPNKNVGIQEGRLKLSPLRRHDPENRPIDFFFRSLAAAYGNRAIAVILSGSGRDGTLGLMEIKREGGLGFAQDKSSAEFPQMPESAIASGCVDFVLSPAKMAAQLQQLGRQRLDLPRQKPGESGHFQKIFRLLRALLGVDFSHYKMSTVRRRVSRRMLLRQIETLPGYVRYLEQNPPEVDLLFHDMLINVTAFFRDEALFRMLQRKVFPRILKSKQHDESVRVWVPGCSTGEEVYSIAMALFEFLALSKRVIAVQIFASDVGEPALQRARAGIYPSSVTASVSPRRLRRFFTKVEGGYQIAKFIRDSCIFARQNLIEDPPFSKLDLISCRNVLIYLGPLLQKKIIPIFHYALKPNGFLVLGGSETVGTFPHLFGMINQRNRIYIKRKDRSGPETEASPRWPAGNTSVQRIKPELHPTPGEPDLQRHVDRVLLTHLAAVGVVITNDLVVLQFRGQTAPYLEHPPGTADLNLLKMVRHELLVDVRTTVAKAARTGALASKTGIQLREGKNTRLIDLEVIPLVRAESKERFYVVLFREHLAAGKRRSTASGRAAAAGKADVALLQEELRSTSESLQAIIEEQDATNEELKSANEEIQSSNEEMQSTNEELQTAKEELQSTNEELTTLNEELQTRNTQLSELNDDLHNLLSSVNVPILMLGNDLTIRRFTPTAEKLFNLIKTDIGRPIRDINPNIPGASLDKMASAVMETLEIQEKEVQDEKGQWYSLRVRPYRTAENRIAGAVVLLIDIHEVKQGLEMVGDFVRHPLLILGDDLKVVRANDSFYAAFQTTPEETENKRIFDLAGGQWSFPALRNMLENVLPERKEIDNFRVEHTFAQIGRRTMLIKARRLQQGAKGTLTLMAIEDVTR